MGIPKQVRISGYRCRTFVPRCECLLDVVCVVAKIENERILLTWEYPVSPRESLHSVQAGQDLVNVHGVQKWLVEPRLEFLRNYDDLVLIFFEFLGRLRFWKPVHPRFGKLDAPIIDRARKSDKNVEFFDTFSFDVPIERLFETYRMQP